MKKKLVSVLLGISLMAVALAGCGGGSSDDSSSDDAATTSDSGAAASDDAAADDSSSGGGDFSVGIAMKTQNGPYFVKLVDTLVEECEARGWDYSTLVADEDIAAEQENIETFISQGVDVIFLDSIDPDACIPAIDEAADAGIPVINVDSGVNGGDYMVTVYSNNLQNGRLSGLAYVDWLNENGMEDLELVCILESGKKGNVAGQERRDGLFCGIVEGRTGCSEDEAWEAAADIEDQLVASGTAEYPDANFKIVGQGWGNWTVEDGLPAAEDFITANPDVTTILGENDQMLFGAEQALEAAGLEGVHLVAAADGAQQAFDEISENDTATNPYIVSGLNSPVLVAREACQIAEDYIQNGNPDDYDDFDDIGDPDARVHLTEAVGVTKDLVDQYYDVGF